MGGILGKEERVYIHSRGVPSLVGNSSKLCQFCIKRSSVCGFCGVGGKLLSYQPHTRNYTAPERIWNVWWRARKLTPGVSLRPQTTTSRHFGASSSYQSSDIKINDSGRDSCDGVDT